MVRNGLSVIAGAGGHDTTPSLVVRQLEQAVQGAPVLEGAGSLVILELEEELTCKKVVERGGRFTLRYDDLVPDTVTSRLYESKVRQRSHGLEDDQVRLL